MYICIYINFKLSFFNFSSNSPVVNIGSYYYKHRDTDSELDTMDSVKSVELQKEELKAREESTEDEFTYSPGSAIEVKIKDLTEPCVGSDLQPSKESIQLLVQKADELVATPNRVDPFMFHTESQKTKLSRVKEWLNFEDKDKPTDSCDASGECTSGESEEDKDSSSSGDLNESVITCRPQGLNDSRILDHSNSTDMISETFICSDLTKVTN